MPSVRAAILAIALLPWTPAARAQPSPPPLATPRPHYVAIVLQEAVARPAPEVWRTVGGFCAIQAWFPGSRCEITAGRDGELGAVRTLNGSVLEVLVGRTELSYAYAQPVRLGQAYNLYHGALEARPAADGGSLLIYSFVFDDSMLPDEAARQANLEANRAITGRALRNMKILAEGGSLPPPAARTAR